MIVLEPSGGFGADDLMPLDRNNHAAVCSHLFAICFGSPRPALAYLPHCLFKPEPKVLAAVLEAMNASGGIFGDSIMWDREGRVYLGDEGKQPEDFVLWELPANQAAVLEGGAFGQLAKFTAVIDARAPTAIVRQMYAAAEEKPEAGISNYVWWVENIARWLPELRWAYIPLNEDCPFAMFVASENNSALAERVNAALTSKGIEVFALRVSGDDVAWPDNVLNRVT